MRFLKTNTAIRLTVGPFFDKTDGVTPEVALTVTSCKLTLMVDTGDVPTLVLDVAPTASGGANDMVHVTNDDAGFYDLELAAANVNYVGRAMLAITDAATHCPVFHEFMILPAKVYDSLVGGTDNLEVDAIQWLGTACATPTTAGVPEVDVTHVSGTAQTARDLGQGIPNAVPGAAGGLMIAGSNAATTFATLTVTGATTFTGNVAYSNGITITQATVNGHGISVTGNGTGKGIYAVGGNGTAGHGIYATSGGGNADGMRVLGTGTGMGLRCQGGASTGNGISAEAGAGGYDFLTNIQGNLSGSVGSVGVGGISSTSFAAGAIDAAAAAADFTTEITAGIRIKKNIALANFMFLMVDSTDHVTPKTGLTITATRSIDGAVFAACANAAAEVANGMYKISLAATDLNGDVIAFKFAGGATADDRLITIVTTT